jgi:hypothetical protein
MFGSRDTRQGAQDDKMNKEKKKPKMKLATTVMYQDVGM